MKASEIKVGDEYAVVASSSQYDMRHKGTVLRKGVFMARVRGSVWSRGHDEERKGFAVRVDFQKDRDWSTAFHAPPKVQGEPGAYWLTGKNIVSLWADEELGQKASQAAAERTKVRTAELNKLADDVNHSHGLSLRVSTYPHPHISASDADMVTMCETLLQEGCGDA